MYDLVFLSYHEAQAEEHWELLKQRFPRATWVKDVDGLVSAHKEAARCCKTRYFWVVDADNVICDDFDFSYRWHRRDEYQNRVAVWRAINNVNGLKYGYGGVKLLPRRPVLDVADSVTDFTTSISNFFHPMEQVASTTVINATPFEAWKAGFRECVKLASRIIRESNDNETTERLDTWKTTSLDVPNSEFVLSGAQQGAEYGERHRDDSSALSKINDWGWLRARFSKHASGEL